MDVLALEKVETDAFIADAASCAVAPSGPDLWDGLLAGLWIVVDRVEYGCHRVFIVQRTSSTEKDYRKLTDFERQVFALTVRTNANKVIASELGTAQSSASKILAKAIQKMGLGSRVQLHELYGALTALPL